MLLSPLFYLEKAISEYPSRICLKINKQEITYGQFAERLEFLISFFANYGVTPGKKVALYADDDLLMLQSIFSLWKLGATAIPMNIKYTPDKLRKIEENIKPDIGFFQAGLQLGTYTTFPNYEFKPAQETFEYPNISLDENSMALIMFTSGSTGIPKGVPITHKALYYNTSLTAERLRIIHEDKIFINTPPYTTSSLIHVLTMFSKGASAVIERGFMFGSNLWSQIAEHNCTGFGGVPVHFSRILSALNKSSDGGKLRFLMNSGEHLPVPIIKKMREKLSHVQIYCVYGLTEVAGRLCILDAQFLDEKIGSVGKPLEGMRITIRDEKENEVDANAEGQIYVSGPLLTSGYINNETVNNLEFTKWGFATGDYGYKDSEGFLFHRGRKDDIIKVGGEKVSLKMIEETLHDFEDFSEFIVHAAYDENMGCVPALQYVMKEGQIFNRPKLIKFLSARLPSTHIPVKFEGLDQIERTSSGKSVRKKTQS